MKYRLHILLALLISSQAWAGWPVTILGDASPTGISNAAALITTAGATSTTAAATSVSASADLYNWWNMNGALGEVFSQAPEVSPTLAATLAKTRQQIEGLRTETELSRDSLVQKAKIVNLTPKVIWQYIKSMRSGDYWKGMRDQLEDKIATMKDRLVEQFSEEALTNAVSTLVEDLMSCNTPQLDTMFPTIDLDLGFAICDYRQMFNDMKDQVKTVADKGWGGGFRINGYPAGDVIKNPSLMKDAVETVSPGVGHALVANMLAEESMRVSLQANVDTSALGKKMAGAMRKKEFMGLFKDRKIIDAVDDGIKAQVGTSQLQAVAAQATNTLLANQNQLQAMQLDNQAREDIQKKKENNALLIQRGFL
jgi:hypothetical protein